MRRRNRILLTILFAFFSLSSAAFTFYVLDQKQLDGLILDATSGLPIPDATVEVGPTHWQSDAAGRFHIPLTGRQNIALKATAPGYLPATFTFDMPWYVRNGQVEIKLASQDLAFAVVDGLTGQPLPGVTLQLGQTQFRTNVAGRVSVDAPGVTLPLALSVDQPGYLPWDKTLMRLPLDSAEQPLVIKLQPHTFTGLIVEADSHKPLPGVTVATGQYSLQTDTNGQFSLMRLKPGDLISVMPADNLLPAKIAFKGQDQLTIPLSPRRLTAQVIDSVTGWPIPDAQLQIDDQVAQTDQEGFIEVANVQPQGMLTINQPNYLARSVPYQADQPAVVSLVPNTIAGFIRDAATGQPLTYTQVMLNGQPMSIGSDGYFRLDSLTQELQLSFRLAGYKPAHLTVSAATDNFQIAAQNLDFIPCQNESSPATPGPCRDFLLEPFQVKAIYVPFSLLSDRDAIMERFDLIDRTELNAVIIDAKSDRGSLAWDSNVEEANHLEIDGDRAGWLTLKEFLAEAKARDIYTIARMVAFKDNPLAFGYPELAIKYPDGTIWLDGEDLAWANPFREEVQAYNIALATEVAALGFDEINIDYIRFPSDGDIGAIYYTEENTLETRTTAIRTYVSALRRALNPYGTALSADVFGMTVWTDPEYDLNIGQRVIDIAPYVDYLSPMIYPSTFISGNLGYDNPSDHPYDIIFRSQNAAAERVPPTARVRPWLQAYWYSAYEMSEQKRAANEAGSYGWFWWNAGGDYDESIFEAGY